MDSEYDVVIAGGGFAGLSAAKTCAEGGVDCIAFERSSEIGYPIHTSGGSFIPDMERLNIPDQLFHPIDRVEFNAPSETAEFEYSAPKFCVIDVRGVQQHLAEQAIDAGATIRTDSKVLDVLEDDNDKVSGVSVRVGETKRNVRASVTIDATGFRSVVAQKADLHDGYTRFGRGAEYDLYAPEYDSNTVHLMVGNDLIPSGYAWIFPYRENRVRVGVGSLFPDSETDIRNSIDKLFEEFGDLGISKDAQIESHSGVIPSEGSPPQTVDDGVLLTGDAANFPFGIVGEGIRTALDTGRVAGQVSAEAVQSDETTQSGLEKYREYWVENYGSSLQVSASINEKLAILDNEEWDEGTQILQSLNSEEFYHLLRSDFSKKRVLDLCMSHPRLFFSLGKVALLAEFKNFDQPELTQL